MKRKKSLEEITELAKKKAEEELPKPKQLAVMKGEVPNKPSYEESLSICERDIFNNTLLALCKEEQYKEKGKVKTYNELKAELIAEWKEKNSE